MKYQLEQRLKELKTEFEAGQKKLADVQAQQADLQNTLLRISGAIQVLEEVLAKIDQPAERDDKGQKSKKEQHDDPA